MKQLIVPYIKSLESASLECINDLIEDFGSRGSIESVNWAKEYSYMPISFFYLGRSSKRLYIKYSVRGNVLRAVNTEDQTRVSDDSCVEFFCRVPGHNEYFNFEFNCIGTCYAAHRIERDKKILLTSDELKQIERLPSLGKKPFNELDGMFFWTLLVSIPFSMLGIGEKMPDYIMANFNKCADATLLKHYVSWSPIVADKPDFHRPDCFGRLLFNS